MTDKPGKPNRHRLSKNGEPIGPDQTDRIEHTEREAADAKMFAALMREHPDYHTSVRQRPGTRSPLRLPRPSQAGTQSAAFDE